MSQQSLDDYLSEMNQLRDRASSVKDDINSAKNRIISAISGEGIDVNEGLKIVGDTASGLGAFTLERGLEPYLKMGLKGAYNKLFKTAADKSKLARQGEQEPAKPPENVQQSEPEAAEPEVTPDAPAAPPAEVADAGEVAPDVANAAEDAVDLSAAARSALRDEVVGKLRNMGEDDLANSMENGENVTDQAIDTLKYKDIFDDEANDIGTRLENAQRAFRAQRSAPRPTEDPPESAPETTAETTGESAGEAAGEQIAEESETAVARAARFVQAARSAGQTTDSTLARAVAGRQAQQQALEQDPEDVAEAGEATAERSAAQAIESTGERAAGQITRQVAAETGEQGVTAGEIASGELENTVANAAGKLTSTVEETGGSLLESTGAEIGEATGGETGGLGLLLGGLLAGVGALVQGIEGRKEKREEEEKKAQEEQEISSAQQQIQQINQQTQQRIASLSKPTMQVGL